MGPDFEMQKRLEVIMETLTNKNNETIVKPTEVSHMKCASNYKDNTFDMGTLLGERNKGADESEDVDLNVVDSKNSHVNIPVQSQDPDMTESSSSFGDTLSEADIGDNESDGEVMSEFCVNNDASGMEHDDECHDLLRLRRKRLRSHWRTFVQPLMWRAKWVELQIKKFQSQALKYDKILEANKKRKQHKVDSFPACISAKSMHYAYDNRRAIIMKRNKRKRSEDLIDNALSNHTLFSYFGTRRSITNPASNGTDWAQLDAKSNEDEDVGPTNELPSLYHRDDSNSWEHLLRKICMAQSKVGELKDRLHKVTGENAGKSTDTTLTRSTLNPASPPNNGDRIGGVGYSSVVSQLLQEYHNMGGNNQPDIIESMGQPRVDGSWRSTGDGVLIHNTGANEELNDFEEAKIHHIDKKLKAPKTEQGLMPPPRMVDQEVINIDDQPALKTRSISKMSVPKNKKKRGKRKARSGKWTRRSSV